MTDPIRRHARNGEARDYLREHLYTLTDACKLWPFNQSFRGYGQISIAGQTFGVHTLACRGWHGPTPPGHEVRHWFCNVKLCFNGAHVAWSTHSENMADQLLTGGRDAIRGTNHHDNRLTESAVREIRARRIAGERGTDLGKEFGVSSTMVYDIAKGQRWAWLE